MGKRKNYFTLREGKRIRIGNMEVVHDDSGAKYSALSRANEYYRRRRYRGRSSRTTGANRLTYPLNKMVTTYANQALQTTGLYSHQIGSDIDKGTDFGSRDGARVYVEFIEVSFSVRNTNSDPAENAWMRMAVLDNKFVGVTLQTKLFQQTGATNAPQNWIGNEPYTLNRRFNTLGKDVYFDRLRRIYGYGAYTNVVMNNIFKYKIPIRRVITYNTEVEDDDRLLPELEFIFWFVSDSNAAFTTALDCDYQVTTFFRRLS